VAAPAGGEGGGGTPLVAAEAYFDSSCRFSQAAECFTPEVGPATLFAHSLQHVSKARPLLVIPGAAERPQPNLHFDAASVSAETDNIVQENKIKNKGRNDAIFCKFSLKRFV